MRCLRAIVPACDCNSWVVPACTSLRGCTLHVHSGLRLRPPDVGHGHLGPFAGLTRTRGMGLGPPHVHVAVGSVDPLGFLDSAALWCEPLRLKRIAPATLRCWRALSGAFVSRLLARRIACHLCAWIWSAQGFLSCGEALWGVRGSQGFTFWDERWAQRLSPDLCLGLELGGFLWVVRGCGTSPPSPPPPPNHSPQLSPPFGGGRWRWCFGLGYSELAVVDGFVGTFAVCGWGAMRLGGPTGLRKRLAGGFCQCFAAVAPQVTRFTTAGRAAA